MADGAACVTVGGVDYLAIWHGNKILVADRYGTVKLSGVSEIQTVLGTFALGTNIVFYGQWGGVAYRTITEGYIATTGAYNSALRKTIQEA